MSSLPKKSDTIRSIKSAPSKSKKLQVTPYSDIERTELKWLWYPFIPMNKVTLIDGDSGIGKSTVMVDLIARLSRGEAFPRTTIEGNEDERTVTKNVLSGVPSSSIIMQLEDGAGDTVRPRLESANADITKVLDIKATNDDPITFPEDYALIEETVKENNVRLVVIDSILDFIGPGYNYNNAQDVRQALNRMATLAEECECSIIMIRHLNKNSGMTSKGRGLGSGAFGQLVRSQLLASETDEERIYAIAPQKVNISAKGDPLTYSIVPSPDDPDVTYIEWLDPLKDVTADDLVKSEEQSASSKISKCVQTLFEVLTDGPTPASKAIEQVRSSLGVSARTVQRAADRLQVDRMEQRSKRIDGWLWVLTKESYDIMNSNLPSNGIKLRVPSNL